MVAFPSSKDTAWRLVVIAVGRMVIILHVAVLIVEGLRSKRAIKRNFGENELSV